MKKIIYPNHIYEEYYNDKESNIDKLCQYLGIIYTYNYEFDDELSEYYYYTLKTINNNEIKISKYFIEQEFNTVDVYINGKVDCYILNEEFLYDLVMEQDISKYKLNLKDIDDLKDIKSISVDVLHDHYDRILNHDIPEIFKMKRFSFNMKYETKLLKMNYHCAVYKIGRLSPYGFYNTQECYTLYLYYNGTYNIVK